MNNFYKEDDVNPRIEFVKVEPNYLEDGVNDTEIANSKEIQRIIKFAPNVRAHSHNHHPMKKKIIRVQYYSKNNRGLTVKKIKPTVPVYKNATVKKRMTIPMPQEQTIALINKIKNEVCIWDSKSEEYKNKQTKYEAWNRVAAHVGIPVEIARAKWTSTLGSFRTYISKQKRGLCTAKKPKWFAYDLLSFLNYEIEETAQMDDPELTYIHDDVMNEEYEDPERLQSEAALCISQLPHDTAEYLEEALSLPEITPTTVNRIAENNVADEDSYPSCNEEILRIVRSMSKVLNKMANIGMPVDYGRYVNQHLKEYDDEIRRKTVKGIMDLITAADEEMSKKYPDRTQIPGINVTKSHNK